MCQPGLRFDLKARLENDPLPSSHVVGRIQVLSDGLTEGLSFFLAVCLSSLLRPPPWDSSWHDSLLIQSQQGREPPSKTDVTILCKVITHISAHGRTTLQGRDYTSVWTLESRIVGFTVSLLPQRVYWYGRILLWYRTEHPGMDPGK